MGFERGGEEAVPLGASTTTTTTTTTTTDANFSTNPRRVRGRRSLRAQSTPTRSSVPPRHPSHGDHGYSRPVQAEPFTENSDRGQRLRRPQLPEDPFNGFRRSSFSNDPLFGW